MSQVDLAWNLRPEVQVALVSFEGVCLTTVILASGASNLGCELPAVDHFRWIGMVPEDPLDRLSCTTPAPKPCKNQCVWNIFSENGFPASSIPGVGPKPQK